MYFELGKVFVIVFVSVFCSYGKRCLTDNEVNFSSASWAAEMEDIA
jgi:hypothetical protein